MKLASFLTSLWFVGSACAGVTDGLLGAYLLDGDAQDRSGQQQHGQVIGATFTADRFGNPIRALQLDGRSAWVSTPVDGQRHPLSISFWFYLDARPGERPFTVLSSSMADAFGHGFVIGSGTNHLNANLAANFSFAARTWTHGVVTYGDTIRVYLDGRLSAEKPTPPDAGVPAGRFSIGRHSGSTEGFYFPGALDDILIYDRVLSAEEVEQLFAGGAQVADQIKAAEAVQARLASLAADAASGDGTRVTRPSGHVATEGPLPLALTVSSIAEPGTNVWSLLDDDTNTAWTADVDATGWWLAAEYEDVVTIRQAALSDVDNSASGVRWLCSKTGDDWSDWTPGEPVELRWLVGLIPSRGEHDHPPVVTELLVR